MARSVEQQLAAVRGLDTTTAKGVDKLREALRATSGIVIAAAARRVAEERLDAVVPELAGAFARLCGDTAAKRDPSCRGKVAIARALIELDRWEDEVFVPGLRIVQREGWNPDGPPDDTAAELRGVCGLAHAHFMRPDALDVLAELLTDDERVTRVAAATGLGNAGRPDASALLRFKILLGEDDPEVLAACFEALLGLSRDAAVDFVLRQLPPHDTGAEAAALALATARVEDAIEPLITWAEECLPEQRHRVGYVALALLRSERANAALLDAIRTRSRGDAIAAGRALATFKHEPALVEQVRDAARAHPDRAVRRELDELLA